VVAAEKADIEKLYGKIDELVRVNTEVQVDIAVIKTEMKNFRIPVQPCSKLTQHLESHRQTKTLWNSAAVRTVMDLVKMGIVLAIGYLFGKKL